MWTYLALATVVIWLWLFFLAVKQLHTTAFYVKRNEAYYVFYAHISKYYVSRMNTYFPDYQTNPATLGVLSCMLIMQLYGFRHVENYSAAVDIVARHEEYMVVCLGTDDYALVFKGMSRNLEYYNVLFNDDLKQSEVLVGDQRVRVASKWWSLLWRLMGNTMALLQELLESGKRLWIVGFSRGGVFAEYTAMVLNRWSHQIGLCTLGKPMAGDKCYKDVVDELYGSPKPGESLVGKNVRCAVVGDPIVSLPFASFAQKSQGWYPTQRDTALWLDHKDTDFLWKYHALRTYYRALVNNWDVAV